jgi:arylformamidase
MIDPNTDFEAEYNNRARVPDHADYILGWHRDAAAYRTESRGELDIAYGPGSRHVLDIFHPPSGDMSGPIVLFIHGGYWQAFDKSSFSHLARGANERGLSVAIPSYDLAPEASLDRIVSGIEAAADFIMERTGRAIVASGHSAGGHLATWLMVRGPGQQRRPIRAAMPISGLFDLVPLVPTSINRALGLSIEEAQHLSPINRQPPNGGHVTAFVGEDESLEFRRQSAELVSSWGTSAVTNLHAVSRTHHFNVVAGLTDPNDILVEMLVNLAAKA